MTNYSGLSDSVQPTLISLHCVWNGRKILKGYLSKILTYFLAFSFFCFSNGRFQKISIPYHGRLLGFPKGRGDSRLWNSEGMGGYLRFEIRRHEGIPQVGFLE